MTAEEKLQYEVFNPVFFEVLQKEAGVVPNTHDEAAVLLTCGNKLLSQYDADQYQKQAEAKSKLGKQLNKLASKLGLAPEADDVSVVPNTPEIKQAAKDIVANADLKKALETFCQQSA